MRKMLTKEKCKNLLEKNGNKYTDEEANLIIDFLNLIIDSQLSVMNSKIKKDEKSCINGQRIEGGASNGRFLSRSDR